jgi:hypothetical protein
MFGGIGALAKPAFDQLAAEISELQRKWLLVADIFQMTVDMAFDERIELRRGPSVSKAVDLCEIERGLPGHSQLRGAWSEFRDVAHLLAAGAYLAREALTRAGSADESSILNAVWIAPDVVLAFAFGLQEFGLQPKPVRKESPILRPNTLWRVPDDHKLKKRPFVAFRRLSDTQLEVLNSRCVGKRLPKANSESLLSCKSCSGQPRSGRGGRRFKSCHSDQHLARFLGAIPTDSPTEMQLDWRLLGRAESVAAARLHAVDVDQVARVAL